MLLCFDSYFWKENRAEKSKRARMLHTEALPFMHRFRLGYTQHEILSMRMLSKRWVLRVTVDETRIHWYN